MSAIGPHVILPTAPALQWAAGAGIVKGIDDTAPFVKAPSNAIRIFRHYFATQDLASPASTVNAILAALNGYNHPNLYVELYNEAYQSNAEISSYCDFLDQAIGLLHNLGYKTAAFSFSTGNPDYPTWSYCRTRSFCHTDLVAMHEYWGTQGFTLNNALRHRTLWRSGDPNIVITECGRDAVEGGLGGWLKDGISADSYVNEIRDYYLQIKQDSYVVGATPFTGGPTPDWQNFDTDRITDLLLPKLQAAGAYNGGNVTDPAIVDLQNRVSALEARDALIYKALCDLLQGKITGADSVMGVLVALNGGKDPGFTPVWPPK